MKKILCIFGTRPEVIKMVSFIKEAKKRQELDVVIVNTGQHIDLTQQMLDVFGLKPDYNLKIMEHKQNLTKVIKNVINKLEPIVKKENPDVMVILGDTNTGVGAGLVAFYNKVPILHMEGGARSFNKYNPFPEEVNRKILDHLADLVTCQYIPDKVQLTIEGVRKVKFVGNYSLDILGKFARDTKIEKQVLITMHRREGWGEPMEQVCLAIKEIASKNEDYTFKISIHPNPIVSNVIIEQLGNIDNIKLLDAMPFDIFMYELAKSKIIMTDSGGIVQEAIFLRKPIIYIRDKSEYEELFDEEFLVSVGKNKDKIILATQHLLDMENPKCKKIDVFGDGTAGERTIDWLLEELK